MAEELQALAVELGSSDPGRRLAAAGVAQHLAHAVERVERLPLVAAVQLHVDAAAGIIGKQGKRRERSAPLTLGAQDVKRGWVEVFYGRRVRDAVPKAAGRVERLALVRKKAAHAPHDRRHGHERDLELGDDPQRAVAADDKVDGVHALVHVVARGVLGARHRIAREVERDAPAELGGKLQVPTACDDLAATQGEHVAVRKRQPQRHDMRAHGPVAVAARP